MSKTKIWDDNEIIKSRPSLIVHAILVNLFICVIYSLTINQQKLHEHQTRTYSLYQIVLRLSKTVTASRALSVLAPTIWNNLPVPVITAENFNVFKRRIIKCHLFVDAAVVN